MEGKKDAASTSNPTFRRPQRKTNRAHSTSLAQSPPLAPRTPYVSAPGHAPEAPPLLRPAAVWLRSEPLSLGSAGNRAAATAEPLLPLPRPQSQPARLWQQPQLLPPPQPRRIRPLRSPLLAEQPLTSPPSRRCRRGPGSAQVSAAEEAVGEGGGGLTWGIVRPLSTRPPRPRCGDAFWSRRPVAGTARPESAASQRVSNGTVPGAGSGPRPIFALRTPPPLPSLPSLPGLSSPSSLPDAAARPTTRSVSSLLPAPRPHGLTSGAPRSRPWPPASRPPSPNLKLSGSSSSWALLSIRLSVPRAVCAGRG